MSHNPGGGHPQGWDLKLADRSSLPPASGEERIKSISKHVFAQPHLPKGGGVGREETEGSSGSSARTPSGDHHAHHAPYLRWARTLHDLLEDAEGVRLFRTFVEAAGGLHLDRLNFYFAVRGLRHETEPAKIRQVVGAIYKFLRKSQLTVPEELRARVKQSLRDGATVEKTVFDAMEHEVTRTIMETTYVAFLRSDAYVAYVSANTQPLSSPDSPSPPSHAKEAMAVPRELATLHEGQELATAPPPPAARLTRDMLMATQSRRALQTETGVFGRSVYAPARPHLTYGGYCVTSRRDSERASLSSGRTDSDALSMSGSSLDGASVRMSARERSHRQRIHGMDRHAIINPDPEAAMVIPRTLRVQSEQLRVLPPEQFALTLIKKLEELKHEREVKERIMESGPEEMIPQMVAAIREKLQVEDDNDQDILDQHVSRVWSERTPGGSPPGGRRAPRPRRRAPSTLSADSGLCDGGGDPPRRAPPKKPPTEFTDSGVSVVSEAAPAVEPRVLQWMHEAHGSERQHRRSYLSSRASSAERGRRADADLASSLSAPQEDRRRHQRSRGSNKPTSGGSSTTAGSGCGAAAEPCTVLVVTFLDEHVPYRMKVPAAPLTLKLFKDYLPRKGNYRYFFKTECADLDGAVIQEEVSNDNETLPMFEGKVMARVKSIE